MENGWFSATLELVVKNNRCDSVMLAYLSLSTVSEPGRNETAGATTAKTVPNSATMFAECRRTHLTDEQTHELIERLSQSRTENSGHPGHKWLMLSHSDQCRRTPGRRISWNDSHWFHLSGDTDALRHIFSSRRVVQPAQVVVDSVELLCGNSRSLIHCFICGLITRREVRHPRG